MPEETIVIPLKPEEKKVEMKLKLKEVMVSLPEPEQLEDGIHFGVLPEGIPV
jgi:hypothetical protein